jgi:hypothetical protein
MPRVLFSPEVPGTTTSQYLGKQQKMMSIAIALIVGPPLEALSSSTLLGCCLVQAVVTFGKLIPC